MTKDSLTTTFETNRGEDLRVARAVEEFMRLCEEGQPPEPAKFAAAHSGIEALVEEAVRGLRFIERAAASIESSAAGVDQQPRSAINLTEPLGDFRLIREIGRGGMGVVYEAEQLSLGRRVAIKVLPLAAMLDERQLKRFRLEAAAAAALKHPNIVSVYCVGCERGVHFYAMEYVEGQTLAAVIETLNSGGPGTATVKRDPSVQASISMGNRAVDENSDRGEVEPIEIQSCDKSQHSKETVAAALSTLRAVKPRDYYRTVAELGMQVAEALDHAHQFGIVHRDIKPANLILDQHQRIWITDFGLAQIQSDHQLTMTGDLLGTLRYMSPEQAAGEKLIDQRTDVYSLGITLYELLMLKPAFAGGNRQQLLREVAEKEPIPPRQLKTDVPRDLETIVLKATSKHRDERYSTAGELAEDLQRFLRSEPIRAKPASIAQKLRRWSRRHGGLVAAAAILLAVTTVLATVAAVLLTVERDRTIAAQSRAEENLAMARDAVNDMYVQVAEKWLADQPQMEPLQREFLLKALAFFERYVEQEGSSPAAQLQIATALRRSGEVHYRLSDFDQAQSAFRNAIERLNQVEQLASTPEAREELARSHDGLAEVLAETADIGREMAPNYRTAIQLWRRLVSEAPQEKRYQLGLVVSLTHLGRTQAEGFEQTDHLLAEARTLLQALIKSSPSDAKLYFLLGRGQLDSSQLRKDQRIAEEMHRSNMEAHDPSSDSPQLVQLRQEVLQFSAQAVESLTTSLRLKPRDPATINLLCNARTLQGGALGELGQRVEGREIIDEAIRQRRNLIADYPSVPVFRKELGRDYRELADVVADDPEAAIENRKHAIQELHAAVMAGDQDVWTKRWLWKTYVDLSWMYRTLHRDRESVATENELATDLLQYFAETYGPECVGPAAYNTAASFNRAPSRYRAPVAALRLAKFAVDADPENGDCWHVLGTAQYRAGEWQEALTSLEKSMEIDQKTHPGRNFTLAMVHWRLGNHDEAREYYERAVNWMDQNNGHHFSDLAAYRAESQALMGIKSTIKGSGSHGAVAEKSP